MSEYSCRSGAGGTLEAEEHAEVEQEAEDAAAVLAGVTRGVSIVAPASPLSSMTPPKSAANEGIAAEMSDSKRSCFGARTPRPVLASLLTCASALAEEPVEPVTTERVLRLHGAKLEKKRARLQAQKQVKEERYQKELAAKAKVRAKAKLERERAAAGAASSARCRRGSCCWRRR